MSASAIASKLSRMLVLLWVVRLGLVPVLGNRPPLRVGIEADTTTLTEGQPVSVRIFASAWGTEDTGFIEVQLSPPSGTVDPRDWVPGFEPPESVRLTRANPVITNQIMARIDGLVEGEETFTLGIKEPVFGEWGYGLWGCSYSGFTCQLPFTIQDADGQPQVFFEAPSSSVSEAVSSTTVNVRLNSPAAAPFTVHWTIKPAPASTATYSSDYLTDPAPSNGTLTFAAGQDVKSITVYPVDDALYEGNKVVRFELSPVVGVTLGTATHTLTIEDNESVPSVIFDDRSVSMAELGPAVDVPVTLTRASASPVRVDWSILGSSTATYGRDYTTVPAPGQTTMGGTLMFSPGVPPTQMIRVTPVPDSDPEIAETVVLSLSNPSGATLDPQRSQYTVTIRDANLTPSVEFFEPQAIAYERSSPVSVAVRLSSSPANRVTVNWRVSGGTATCGMDFNQGRACSGTLSFDPGVVKTSELVLYPTTDNLVEPMETINLLLESPVNATLGAQRTFQLELRDSSIQVMFDLPYTTTNLTEGAVLRLPIRFSNPLAEPTKILFEYTAHGATPGEDFRIVDNFTAAAGMTSALLGLELLTDFCYELYESFDVSIAADESYTVAQPSRFTCNILDDDPKPNAFFSNAGGLVYPEFDFNLEVEVSLDRCTGVDVDVPIIFSGTAMEGRDYTIAGLKLGRLRIPAGQTSGHFTIQYREDTRYDGPEKTVLATIFPGSHSGVGKSPTYSLSVVDDDPVPTVSFEAATSQHLERINSVKSPSGFSLPWQHNLVVSLSAPADVYTVVAYHRIGGTASPSECSLDGEYLVFGPGTTQRIITVGLFDDALDESSETVVIGLARVAEPGLPIGDGPPDQLAHSLNLGAITQHTVTILDNDPPPVVSLLTSRSTVPEIEGEEIGVRVQLNEPSGLTVSVGLSLGGTAVLNADYTAQGFTSPLLFRPGEITKNIRFLIRGDNLPEGDETLVLSLGTIISGTPADLNSVTVTLQDDDVPTLVPEPAYALGTSPGHRVRIRKSSDLKITTIELAETLLAAPLTPPSPVAFEVFDHGIGVINYVDAATTPPPRGHAGGDRDFHSIPGSPTFTPGDIDHMAMEATGFLEVAQPGNWTFLVRSDEGFRLRLGADERIVMENALVRPASDSTVVVNFPRAGAYRYRLTYFEANGGAEVEFLAVAPGQSIAQLVGAGVGLTVAQDIDIPPVVWPEPAGFTASNPGHAVDFARSASWLNHLDDALNLMASPASQVAQATDDGVAVINYLDSGEDGLFTTGNRSVATPPMQSIRGKFSADGDDDFVMRATGFIYLAAPGVWTFGVHSDEGFRLRLGRQLETVAQYYYTRGRDATTRRIVIPEPGYYGYELIWFEGGGDAEAEFFVSPPGQPMVLVGDTVNGGPAVFQSGQLSNAPLITVSDREPDTALFSHPGFDVRFRKAAITFYVGSIGQAEFLMNEPLPSPAVAFELVDAGVPAINYVDAATDPAPQGLFGLDRDIHDVTGTPGFAAGNVDHFAVSSSGWLQVPQGGVWRLSVRSDDGFRLRLGAARSVVMGRILGRSAGESWTWVNFTTPGFYRFELTYFETAGGAQLEFYARRPGSAVDEQVGLPGSGLQAYRSIDLPPTVHPNPSFLPGTEGHLVHFRRSGTPLVGIDSVTGLFAANLASDQVLADATIQPLTINYLDAGPDGLFTTGNSPVASPPLVSIKGSFSSGGDDHYALHASGYLRVDTPGVWTLGVHSGDGFRLMVGADLQTVCECVGPRPAEASLRRIFFPEAGYYPYVLWFFETTGESEVEFFATPPGTSTQALVGDPGGQMRVFQPQPCLAVEPGSPALLRWSYPSVGYRLEFKRTLNPFTSWQAVPVSFIELDPSGWVWTLQPARLSVSPVFFRLATD